MILQQVRLRMTTSTALLRVLLDSRQVGRAPLRLWNSPGIGRVLARSRVPSSSQGISRMKLGRTLPILIYFLPAIPWAFLSWFPTVQQFKYMGWLFFPYLGPLVLAIVVLPALFILRSLLVRGNAEGTGSPRPAPRGLLIVFGILLGTVVSIAWWRLFEHLTLASGYQDFIFGRQPYGSGHYPGTLSSRIEFARGFIISAVAYFGILGGELAAHWSPEQRVFDWRPGGKRSELILDLWLLWVVLYSVPIMVRGGGYILAAPQLATALACILLCFPLTHRAPASRKSAIRDSVVAGIFITLLACLILLPSGFLAFLPLAFTWVGFAWGWISGGLLWRFFQLPGATASAE
jgi:amino acid permease